MTIDEAEAAVAAAYDRRESAIGDLFQAGEEYQSSDTDADRVERQWLQQRAMLADAILEATNDWLHAQFAREVVAERGQETARHPDCYPATPGPPHTTLTPNLKRNRRCPAKGTADLQG